MFLSVAEPEKAKPKPAAHSACGSTLVSYLLGVARTRLNTLEDDVAHAAPSSEKGGDIQDLVSLLSAITMAVKSVGALVSRAGIGAPPPQPGESAAKRAQKELAQLNKKANQIWINALLYSGKTCLLVSEDLDQEIVVEEPLRGKYCVVFGASDVVLHPQNPPISTMHDWNTHRVL
jgi:Fructose-1-6-bisphosphatase, N-terminal domain